MMPNRPAPGYRTDLVPVRGGELTVGIWGDDDAPTVIAVHGITATHRAWALLGETARDLRIVAPDLRGRGRSNTLPGPWGMATHADDLAAVVGHFGLVGNGLAGHDDAGPLVVVGHSMGAFAAVALAARHPLLVDALVLVDGGLPIPPPPGVAPADIPEAMIGAAARRLGMTFATSDEYRAFWREHPAFADWTPVIEQYVDYDLDGLAPRLTPSGDARAVAQDAQELSGEFGYLGDLAAVDCPIDFIRAPRDLSNELPGLYPPSAVADWQKRMPRLRVHEAAGVNHYTIVMGGRGLEQVLPVIRAALLPAQPDPPAPQDALSRENR
ncbi:MAG: alpha/beta hydrolase [Burkholderiaceae bacterium]|nr:alpha/beta hydrolase [Microbacteriaceae bacterium]